MEKEQDATAQTSEEDCDSCSPLGRGPKYQLLMLQLKISQVSNLPYKLKR
jgi:hypothetical protein